MYRPSFLVPGRYYASPMTRRLYLPLLALSALLAATNQAEELAEPDYHAPKALLEHKALFRDTIEQVGDTPVWALIDHGVNMVLIEGPEGLVLFDTGLHDAYATKALARIREISDKPIVALVYSHHHVDHVGGAGFFVDAADVKAGKVEVIGAANLTREMADENVMTAPIMALRSAHMFGFALEGRARRDNYVGCCGELPPGAATPRATAFIPPTVLVDDQLTLELGGITFEFFHTGGESASHIAAWLPQYQVLLSGDEIQGPTFPNLHSLRGTRMRDANAWVQGLDRMREVNAEHLVPTHGNPVSGRDEIERILTVYRDAIQYTHDQAIRYINKGLNHDELGHQLPRLPDYLLHEPWTGEHYGNVPSAVRSYYTGYISWFSGDAVDLMPTPRVEYARRLVSLIGGREPVLAAAAKAFRDGDAQFAAELASYLIRMDKEDRAARGIKAKAFRTLGYAQANMNWRNFYLMGARELDGELDTARLTGQLNNPDNLARLPLAVLVDNIRYRVNAEQARDARIRLGLAFPGEERYVLELRNSVIQIHRGARSQEVELKLDAETFAALMLGSLDIDQARKHKRVSIKGKTTSGRRFFSLLDYDMAPKSLVVR